MKSPKLYFADTGIAHFAGQLGTANVIRSAVICRTPNAYPLDKLTSAWPIDLPDEAFCP